MITLGYAAQNAESPLRPWSFQRRDLRPDDVAIEILYCGVCHSDLHTARNDWGGTLYPSVPGHEIVGRVTAVGAQVSGFKPGDMVAVGTLVDSCRSCPACASGEEQFCVQGAVGTYGGRDRATGETTYGGYSAAIVVRESFVLPLPEGLDPAVAGPILCAGITVWSPLRRWEAGPGTKLGVIGIGGLGHMAIKLGAALGAEVTAITTSAAKAEEAARLGAARTLVSKDPEALKAAAGSLDLIIDTVPVKHDLSPYLPLLGRDGTLVIVGMIGPTEPFHTGLLLRGRRRISGSAVGGIAETRELLAFCAEKGVAPDVEMIEMQGIEAAFARMEKGDVKYRFVIDMGSLKREAA
ncbi:NAD(P)-dependent alcohol dehydrogenase [Neomegalonema perideroedes]|uniref:NAD(P)-dependent alcohol dehydrogenase n=1 Tax=Neomegalonema perideroedes TaxID=217219 RepID=UPI00036984E7|nr:NAD(P)-dependent alcohol dehydrogenase [Neomegalonema perideroedes]